MPDSPHLPSRHQPTRSICSSPRGTLKVKRLDPSTENGMFRIMSDCAQRYSYSNCINTLTNLQQERKLASKPASSNNTHYPTKEAHWNSPSVTSNFDHFPIRFRSDRTDRSNARYALITVIIIVATEVPLTLSRVLWCLSDCSPIELHDVTTLAARDTPAIDSVSDALSGKT
jgi:hypothetical protein